MQLPSLGIVSALLLISLFPSGVAGQDQQQTQVLPVAKELATNLNLDTKFYKKHLDSDGLPILASRRVSKFALHEANWIINKMLEGRSDIRQAIVSKNIRVVIMASTEMTTDVPEHSDLHPAEYWDKRARGLGATDRRPAISCGEENLLEFPGDPYRGENILVHEFAHVIHQHGLQTIDPNFNAKLKSLFIKATSEGLWKDKYAGSNHSEYFAEAVQSWFGTNLENDKSHNHVNTRAELKAYDPRLAALMQSIFRGNQWKYLPPSKRRFEKEHLAKFDLRRAPRFKWPDMVSRAFHEHQSGIGGKQLTNLKHKDWSKARSEGNRSVVALTIRNQSKSSVTVYWIGFDGSLSEYGKVQAGGTFHQSTFSGHLWQVKDSNGKIIGQFKAASDDCTGTVQ